MKRIALLTLLLSLALACAAPSAPPPPAVAPTPGVEGAKASPTPVSKLEKVKMQITSASALTTNFSLGQEKGILKEEGLELEIIPMKTGLAVPSLTAGEIDFALVVGTPFNAALMGVPVKLLMNTVKKPMWHIVVAKEINAAADLKGKTFGISGVGGSDHFATRIALKQLGLDPDKDVIWNSIADHAQKYAALKVNAVAAISVPAPFNVLAKEEGYKILAFTGDYADIPIAGLVTTDRKLKDNPGQVKRMLRATLKSMAYMKEHVDEAEASMTKLLNIDRKTARASWEDIVRIFAYDGSISDQALQNLVEVGRASGAIKGEVDIKKGVSFDLLKEVQKELKLAP